MKKFRIEILETEFGSSTSCEIEVRNEVISDVKDTSTNKTNWYWDGWTSMPQVGWGVQEFDNWEANYFKDWSDEFRQPFLKTTEIKVLETV